MIYFDNGATSFPKPRGMINKMEECLLRYCGNPGRSGHDMSLKTGEGVYKARKSIGALIGTENIDRIIFTKNTTEAINLGIKGVLNRGDNVITTSMEHNSVLRPLKALTNKGINHKIIYADKDGRIDIHKIEEKIDEKTRMIVCTQASNVVGTIMPIAEIGKITKKHNILFMVDGAQGLGVLETSVDDMNIDILAGAGHKSLLGPQGTGFIYISPRADIRPMIEGGTGTASKDRNQPIEFPEGFEAGTVNAPAIIGLGYSVDYVNKITPGVIKKYEEELIRPMEEMMRNMSGVTVYGPSNQEEKTGIILFNIDGMSSEEVTSALNTEYNIAVRGGFHCAGLAHKSIGTWRDGAVRLSVGPFNTKKEITMGIDAIYNLSKRGEN